MGRGLTFEVPWQKRRPSKEDVHFEAVFMLVDPVESPCRIVFDQAGSRPPPDVIGDFVAAGVD
jgi:hypothetical protein